MKMKTLLAAALAADPRVDYVEEVIAGIDWVTAHQASPAVPDLTAASRW